MPLKLDYGFNSNPYPIRASVTGTPNTIDLSVTISQPGEAVALQSITIEIPMGSADDVALSTAKDLPQPVYDQRGQWNITVEGGAVTIVPRTGSSAEVTTPIEFILPGIGVNTAEGFVRITITEVAPVKIIDQFTYRLEKLDADFPVTKFYAADPVLNDLDRTTTLYWECTSQGQDYSYRLHTADVSADQGYGWMPKECLLSGDCYGFSDGKAGVRTPQLGDETVFALDVIKADPSAGRVVHKTLLVTVRVQVPYFSQAARLTRVLSRFAFLRWRAFNASRVTLRMNDDIIDVNAPADPYLYGYLVTLGTGAPRGRFHLTAHAPTGDAQAYYAAFPDIAIQPSVQLGMTRQYSDSFLIQNEPVSGSFVAAAAKQLAIVSCKDDESVHLIDLNSRTLSQIWSPRFSYPQAVALTPDGKVAILGGQGVRGIDCSNGNTVWGLGNNCDGMALSADGSTLLISWINTIGVVDMKNPSAGTTAIQTPYPATPGGMAEKLLTIAISRDGSLAIIGESADYFGRPANYLTILNVPQRKAEDQQIPITDGYYVSQVAITPDGRQALATAYNDSQQFVLMLIDVPNRRVTDTIPLSQPVSRPAGNIAIGDSYAFILMGTTVEQGPNTVAVFDLAQKTIVATLDADVGAVSIAVTPDNSALVIANTAGVLII